MDLRSSAEEIREILELKRQELHLRFIEEEHKYYMRDTDGIIKTTFPSVSKVIKKFYEPFDANGISRRMAGGDVEKQKELLQEWNNAAQYSANMGSRVHYELEKELICRHGGYKEVRQPIFEIDDEQTRRSDNMIYAGKKFIDLMEERGAVLLDTEIIMGDPHDAYTGQPDKIWLVQNKEKNDFGFVITDYKTNKPKNFEVQSYTKKMLPPFNTYHDTALSHYYLQLPLYGRLLLNMLRETKYDNKKILGGIVVLLKDDAEFQEYRVPSDITKTILTIDIRKYTK
jgi:hypothetical protein